MAPFHRSGLFWSGLLVTVALLWGWLAFPECVTQVNWVRGNQALGTGDRSRVFTIGTADSGLARFPQGLRFTGLEKGQSLSTEEMGLFPPAVRRHQQEFPPSGVRVTYVSVSYWLLLLC